jgi:hypothetical protein
MAITVTNLTVNDIIVDTVQIKARRTASVAAVTANLLALKAAGKVSLSPNPTSSTVVPTLTVGAALTFGSNITAATANGSLTDSAGTNPTDAQFNELAKELGTKINALIVDVTALNVAVASLAAQPVISN